MEGPGGWPCYSELGTWGVAAAPVCKAPQLDVEAGVLGSSWGPQLPRLSSASQQLPLHGAQERLCRVLTHVRTHRAQDLALAPAALPD